VVVEGMIIDWKFHAFFPTKKILDYGNSAMEINFPPELFDGYTAGGPIYGRVYLTDWLVTTADMKSFVQDKFLYQRQIEAQINDSLLNDPQKRYELCVKLLDYAYQIVQPPDTSRVVMQTKIELVYLRHITPFIAATRYFNYYYDDGSGKNFIDGGFEWDSLTRYYFQTQKNIRDSVAAIMSNGTGMSKDSAVFYMERHDTLQLARLMTPVVQNRFYSLDPGALIDPRILKMRPIAFDSVKPINRSMFASGYLQFEIFGDPFYDAQEIGAIGLRNSLGFRSER
jgi:hypothetical protein